MISPDLFIWNEFWTQSTHPREAGFILTQLKLPTCSSDVLNPLPGAARMKKEPSFQHSGRNLFCLVSAGSYTLLKILMYIWLSPFTPQQNTGLFLQSTWSEIHAPNLNLYMQLQAFWSWKWSKLLKIFTVWEWIVSGVVEAQDNVPDWMIKAASRRPLCLCWASEIFFFLLCFCIFIGVHYG